MRIGNSYNFTPRNNYSQHENHDFINNVPIQYGNKHENKPTCTQFRYETSKTQYSDVSQVGKHSNEIQFSPRSPRGRNFLRHTTYVIRPEMMEKKKNELHQLSIGKPFMESKSWKNYPMSDTVKFPNQSFPIYSGSFKKYKYQQYDRIAEKMQAATSFVAEIKQLKEQQMKMYQPSKYSTLTSQTEQISKDNIPNSTHYIVMDGFRKKINQDFYTPKIQTSLNLDKNKRVSASDAMLKRTSQQKKNGIHIEDFIIVAKIGGGKYGTVYKAFHIRTRTVYALKKISKQILKDQMMVTQFILEVKLQSYLKHQNILEIYGVFDDQQNVYLILEYMVEGTLYKELKKNKKLSEVDAAIKIKQIAKAIVYMHQNGIVHRDIKPQNIVISGGVCKLCDFGWATVCDDRRKTYCGTFDYAAPEILQGAQYDLTVDLWCLGVLAYELMVGKAPFYHISKKQTIANIINVENKKISYPNTMSQRAISFISCLLKKIPQQRLGYEQVLNHPFLKEVKELN